MIPKRPSLIIIDDDPLITDTLHFVLGSEFDVHVAESRMQTRSLLRQLEIAPDLALVDLGLPPTPNTPEEGFKIIGELLAHAPTMKILVLSGQNEGMHAKHALALGAFEYLSKPCDVDRLRSLLRNALKMQGAERSEPPQPTHNGLLGESFSMQSLRSQITQYADAPFPVLIDGESGSGKELVARSLHQLSKRKDEPYLSLNCAAISPSLAESTLFGHGKGAFTGAAGAQSGYFEDAGQGTLFLDEIGELPQELQAKLLRVLENGEFQRVGETKSRQSKARIIAATNRDLKDEVRAGRFRIDLFHRLSVFSIHVPALRNRDDDTFSLLKHFGAFYAREAGSQTFTFSDAARNRWASYHFPGNVRELRNIIIRLTAKYPGLVVSEDQLVAELDLGEKPAETNQPLIVGHEDAVVAQAYKHLQSQTNLSLDVILKDWENAYIKAAMKITNGNLSQAAKLLGINRTTLYSRMRMHEDIAS